MNRILSAALFAIALPLVGGGVAYAGPPRPIDRASSTTGPDGSPLSAEDLQELKQMEEAVHQFESANKEYRGTITHIVRQDYDKRRRELVARYDDRVKSIEGDEHARRLDAIKAFEEWLKKYPNDGRWTPDVIFRLAELYFERSNDDYLAAVDTAQKAADAAQKAGKADQAPQAPPTPDYTLTINLYKRLIREFVDYRLIDGAYYLLGYCQGEMNQEPEAKQAYLALVCTNQYKALDPPAPPQPTKDKKAAFIDPYTACNAIQEQSRFVPEAWTRIGEYHFDSNELELAIAAYARVLKYKDSPYYDKALYKLAWAFYRADKYPEAIQKFDELVKFSDARKSESGKEGSDLRQEAVQYLGISFAEKDWNGDGVDDTETGLGRIEGFYANRDKEEHTREIYQKLGDIYFDETEYQKAVDVYRRLLDKWPYGKDNPKVQDRIVQAFKRQRKEEETLVAIRDLALNYGPGKPWYKANRDDKEAIDKAAELAEQAMVTTAVEHHRRAQIMKKSLGTPADPQKISAVAREYQMASEGYQAYLAQYPNSKNTYDYTFFFAETLYYSGRFAEAAVQYEKIRDSNLDNRYMEDAAFNAVKAYEKQVEQLVLLRKLALPPLPEAGKVQGPVKALAIPDEVLRLQRAYDEYSARLPQSGKVPTMLYKAAEIEFKYLEFDKARPRMQTVFEKYCAGNDVGAQAGNAILAMYTIENNLDQIAEWADKMLKGKCGTAETVAENEGKIKDLASDVRFQKAMKDFNDQKFEEAAAQFVKIVDGDPQNKSGNNDKALYNAATGYEKVSRFQAATKLFERIVNEYPKSGFVDDALFRTAVNYQRYFEFDKAVVSYQRLATDPQFKASPNRINSLYNAAVLLENDQAYPEAARLFQQYANLADASIKKEDQAEAFFRSGLIFLKNKDVKNTIRTFQDYVKGRGTDPKKTIEASFRVAEAYELQKKHAEALTEYKNVVEEGARVPAASDAAEFPAHAAFILAEEELPKLEKLKISADPKTLKRDIDAYKVQIQRITTMYEQAIQFRRVTWSLAGFFRIGYCYELLSRALAAVASAPCPKEVERKYKQEGCDLYNQQITDIIEKLLAPIDEEVVKRYRVTLEQAARFGAANEWTKLARNRANAFKPDEFPLVKDEKIDMQMETPL